jgi:hypothetical protein
VTNLSEQRRSLSNGRPAGSGQGRWTGRRVLAVVVGGLLAAVLVGVGGYGLDATGKPGGYVDLASGSYRTDGYALTMPSSDLARFPIGHVHTLRITISSTNGPVFVGVTTPQNADRYLSGVAATMVTTGSSYGYRFATHPGTAPAQPPAGAVDWAGQASGDGTRTLVWPVRGGAWTLVAMNADGTRLTQVHADVAATIPGLRGIAYGATAAGVVLLAGAVTLIVLPIRRARRAGRAGPAWPVSSRWRDGRSG